MWRGEKLAFWKAALKRWWSNYKKDWPWNVVVYVLGAVAGAIIVQFISR